MTVPSNLRSLPLRVAADNLRDWLATQSDAVREVTSLDGGVLVQRPVISDTFVDPTAQIIGGAIIHSGCYIGPYAVVRLDEKPTPEPLIIGRDTNLQDFSVVHSTTQSIGERVVVAHQAIVHGAVIEDDVTIYIQAVADGGGTIIGRGGFLHRGSYVGRGIRVPEGRYVPPGQCVLTQAEADALAEVPEELRAMRDHVLELNASHCRMHSAHAFAVKS